LTPDRSQGNRHFLAVFAPRRLGPGSLLNHFITVLVGNATQPLGARRRSWGGFSSKIFLWVCHESAYTQQCRVGHQGGAPTSTRLFGCMCRIANS